VLAVLSGASFTCKQTKQVPNEALWNHFSILPAKYPDLNQESSQEADSR
jgi:hypothetical protein